MFASRPGVCRQETAQLDLHPEQWRRLSFRSAGEVPALLDIIVAAMEDHGYARKDLFAARLALEEALVNAVKHGNRGDPAKEARLRYHVNAAFVLLEVEDEGAGFDPSLVPDPLAPDNLERASGRGLFLIQKYMTWVEYNERGNCVTMCKHRTGS
jgi:serine/threonine-protein kinase RsbW